MTKYILYYDPKRLVDYKEYIKEYNFESVRVGNHEPRLMQFAPLLINVDGSYINIADLGILTCKTYPNNKPYNEYVWARDYNGQPIRYKEEKHK